MEVEELCASWKSRTRGQSFASNQVGEMALHSEGLECGSRVVIVIVVSCLRTIGMLVHPLKLTGWHARMLPCLISQYTDRYGKSLLEVTVILQSAALSP